MNNTSNEFEVIIPNNFKYMTVMENLLQDLMELAGYLQEEIDNTWLAFHEAIVNAIQHGNKNDPEKKVKVLLDITLDWVQLTVEDQGKGFDPQIVSNCTDESHRLCSSGRGIFLMKHYMDQVSFDTGPSGPTRVTLRYKKKTPVSS